MSPHPTARSSHDGPASASGPSSPSTVEGRALRVSRPCLTRIATRFTAALAIVPALCLAGVLVAAASSRAAAQGSERISGTVTGEVGQPLAGVQVTIVDTRLGG